MVHCNLCTYYVHGLLYTKFVVCFVKVKSLESVTKFNEVCNFGRLHFYKVNRHKEKFILGMALVEKVKIICFIDEANNKKSTVPFTSI